MNDDSSRSLLLSALRELAAREPAGTRLPTVRTLQREYRVSPATVQAVTREMAAAGLVEVRPAAGTFVAAHPVPPPRDTAWQQAVLGGRTPDAAVRALDLVTEPPAGTIRLSGGYLDEETIPTRALGASLARAGRRPGVWGRSPVDGEEALRRWFARAIGGVAHDEVVVTAGGQSALSIAIRALTRPGQPVLMESPGYLGAISIARTYGLETVPVPTDAHGMRTDLLDDALTRTGARLVVVQPLFANPTGTTLPPERRAQLLDTATRHSAFVLEDDYARDLVIDTPVPPTLMSADRTGHVVHVRSLTKAVAPGLRVAALAARGPALARLRAAKALDDLYVSGPLQAAALDFLTSSAFPRHQRAVSRQLAHRRDALLRALTTHLPGADVTCVPRGGMHVWVRLPDGTDPDVLAARALAAGVLISAGTPWFPAEPDGACLRLTYGQVSADQIGEGIRRLSHAM
ncbi:PLP-dependent aminotransferase family protein [Streptomyces sp. NPDC047000]|uniref:aminotransferase-like domain-containing protein n=1 Tax=Streptomyces sp. NPDC047000 TaxID=3155474 RepID=UPI0033F6377B